MQPRAGKSFYKERFSGDKQGQAKTANTYNGSKTLQKQLNI
jgi:hypothetical protein